MTDAELLTLNQQGFIPGPTESENHFLDRVTCVKKSLEEGDWIPSSHWDWVRTYVKETFDFEPESLPAFYSNQNLRVWQGAAAWIEGRRIVSIQLREALKRGSYLGIYKREEILAHEAVHAARSAFDELGSEEFFAYMTSENRFHRIFGPILRRPWEIWPFFMGMAAGAFSPFGYFFATLWVTLGFYRLIRQHRRLRLAAENILKSVGNKKVMRAVLFRLTDREIEMVSRGKNIEEYAKEQTCLRWRVISLAYLKGDVWLKKLS